MGNNTVWQDKKHFMWWPITFTSYSITPDRLLEQTGFISKNYEEVYLYRIMDVKLTISFMQRLFGTGTITLIASDATTPAVELINVKDPERVKEMISQMADEQRRNRIYETVGNLNYRDSNDDGFPDFIS